MTPAHFTCGLNLRIPHDTIPLVDRQAPSSFLTTDTIRRNRHPKSEGSRAVTRQEKTKLIPTFGAAWRGEGGGGRGGAFPARLDQSLVNTTPPFVLLQP